MPESDWRHFVAIGGLIALLFAGGYSLHQQSVFSREYAGQAVAESREQDAKCEPGDDYYLCADLNAQAGMRRSTDTLASQGNWQLTLGLFNLLLLIGTLVASIVATFVAARAVKVSRLEMENGLQPRLGANLPAITDWDPGADGDWFENDEFLPKTTAKTEITFHNYGEAAAFLVMTWGRHYIRAKADGFPPPMRIWNLGNPLSYPEGNWVKKGMDSQSFDYSPLDDIEAGPGPRSKHTNWYIMGCVAYEGLQGVRYLTRYCFYFDDEDKAWYLGPGDWMTRALYNKTERLDSRWRNRIEREILFNSQQ